MQLIDKLPTSYHDINYKTYIKIIQAIPAELPEGWDEDEYNSYITLIPLSIFLDIPVIDLERLPATEIVPMLQRLQFMNEPIPEAKTTLKLKAESELTYDEFVSYQKLRLSQWDNMEKILNLIIKDKTAGELSLLTIPEVVAVFFILNKSTNKSIQSLKRSLGKQMMKQNLKVIWAMFKGL
ncbi:hypothetical protein LJ707_13275 [Mucilaginibacter sp. UR6-1]|uniref:hypothetical protein n=1 Tax=Mucilaginibacter sp. UR6-1 TaxID=1435643 RepID=UPI001E4D921F|nr:hypothetical protein [Mucilaginibacter sp. UR6-1]MCC8409903.1 hypothetical protein [Mucilaginibacter sp. UR6-1]